MKVRTTTVDAVTVLALSGDVDAGAADTELLELLPPFSDVVVDLTEVAHMTSAGVRTLLLLYRQGQCLDVRMAVVGLSAQLHEVLRAVGFLEFFVVGASVADGVALLRSSRAATDPAKEAVHA